MGSHVCPARASSRSWKQTLSVHHRTDQKKCCFPFFISFICGVRDVKGMSTVRHHIVARPPWVRGLTKTDTAWNLRCDRSRTFPETEIDHNSVRFQTKHPTIQRPSHIASTSRQVKKNTEKTLECVSLFPWSLVLEQDGYWTQRANLALDSLFALPSFRNLYFGIWNVLEMPSHINLVQYSCNR